MTITIQNLKKRITAAINDRVFPGCVAGIIRRGKSGTVIPFGRFTYDNASAAMKKETMFDVASLTKSIPTSSLALKLIDEGQLKLDGRVIDFIPELRHSRRDRVLIRHLLTQTLDFGFRLSALKDNSADQILDAIYSTELQNEPGATFFYSNATSILLGIVIERLTGKCLSAVADEVFFKPLAMNRTTFFPESLNRSQIVPTEFDGWRGRLVQGEVHDESAFRLRDRLVAGSAGLFSTVPDILKFLEMMLHDGEAGGVRYLSREIVAAAQTNQIDIPGATAGLGWELCRRQFMGSRCSGRTFGKTGFTGCSCMADPEKGVGFVLLSNCTYPRRKPDTALITSVRSDCADIVFSL
jgi:CubicO group peptidase (beta-lactamase class C family)